MKRFCRCLAGLVVLAAVLYAGLRLKQRHDFPYGRSHSCDIGLYFALRNYAETHDGRFPSGEATPEASLSLLFPKLADEEILRGKTVPKSIVDAALANGGRLSPETCGWHYVEGLTIDDSDIALFWDKAGLGHNGQRLDPPGHTVWFVGGRNEFIRLSDWRDFERAQAALLAERAPSASRER